MPPSGMVATAVASTVDRINTHIAKYAYIVAVLSRACFVSLSYQISYMNHIDGSIRVCMRACTMPQCTIIMTGV